MHEVSTHHREGDAVTMLCWELHTLFELSLKHIHVEAEYKIVMELILRVE